MYEQDIAVIVIPTVTLPLTPHSCMCQSMETVASNFHIQFPVQVPVPPISYNCTRGEHCDAVVCVFDDNSEQAVTFTFDPCAETILVSGSNTPTGSSEVVLFNQTEDRDFAADSYSFILHMELINSNYSMNFSVRYCHACIQPVVIFVVMYLC